MNDEKYPVLFHTGIENAETMEEISLRTGLFLSEVRSCIVFWLTKGREINAILLSTPDHKYYLKSK